MSFTVNATGHDTHLYDPDHHDNQIVAVFEDDEAASRARDALLQTGLPESAIQVMAAPEPATPQSETTGGQLMNALSSLFSSDSEQQDYAHAVSRGHAMLVVTPTGNVDRHKMIQVLEQSNPIDFDAKLEEWRQAGYEGMGVNAEMDRRIGRRESTEGQSRVRSYIADRSVPGLGPAGTTSNATEGSQSSGMNAPPR